MEIKLEIIDKLGNVRNGKNEYEELTREMTVTSVDSVHLATQELIFEEGDAIVVNVDQEDAFLIVKFDETLSESLVFVKNKEFRYSIPLAEGDVLSQSEFAFKGRAHYISARAARDYEISQYRNLAFNSHDQKDTNSVYPHAIANVETRNDSTFFAKNVINGMHANLSHGPYPYQSWGINRQADAKITIEFGRNVKIDSVGIVLRADFPHDSYWEEVTLEFSDGSTEILNTVKSDKIQTFNFKERLTNAVSLMNLKKADDESPFPALTEFEVYGIYDL